MNNIKQLSSLLIFSEVANKQSFTLAAKHLGMSKSAISQQVKRLEQTIGQQLLSRNTRGMSLTTTGEKLLNRCELLRDQVDLAFEELNHSKETPSGTFALTIPHSCEKDIVIPAVSQLCVEFPQIEPIILVTDEAQDLIQNNLDVAIYAGELKDSNYRALPIGNIHECFCATPAYLHKYGQLTETSDLLKHRLIATSWQKDALDIYKTDALNEKKIINIKYFAKTNTLPSALEMVLHDMGIALLPTFVIQSTVTSGHLVRILPEYQGRQWPLYMVHRFQGEKPVYITRFYQLVKHFYSKVNNKTW
ncbi:Transcriptional regulator, LysR family [hydrothermal vent metagenome]|uniref:Transcriptional regulator, LysR family n=1 Tax=hydrothermal vent metagenome TaxID=652676 RepID=A0A3B0XCA7_9ZZZZ